MYKSNKFIQNKSLPSLKKDLQNLLNSHKYIYCKALRRKIFLDKLPEVIIKRLDARRRLQCFFIAIDVIKNSQNYMEREKDKQIEFEFFGFSAENKKVFIHIREEKDAQKNKRLFLVSTFFSG
jgi:hypothetical protein